MSVKDIKSKHDLDVLRNSGKVILINFYTDWSEPCKLVLPEFETLAREHAEPDVLFCKLNIDTLPGVAEELGVRSVPAFHAYKSKEKLDTVVGTTNKVSLAVFVKTSLARAIIV